MVTTSISLPPRISAPSASRRYLSVRSVPESLFVTSHNLHGVGNHLKTSWAVKCSCTIETKEQPRVFVARTLSTSRTRNRRHPNPAPPARSNRRHRTTPVKPDRRKIRRIPRHQKHLAGHPNPPQTTLTTRGSVASKALGTSNLNSKFSMVVVKEKIGVGDGI